MNTLAMSYWDLPNYKVKKIKHNRIIIDVVKLGHDFGSNSMDVGDMRVKHYTKVVANE